MNKQKGRLILLLSIIVLASFFTWIIPVYQNYSYYKSSAFANTSWRIQNQFYGMFLDRYYRNPRNGDEFLAFCDNEFQINFNQYLDKNIKKDGIIIIDNEINDTIIILGLGKDRKRNKNLLSLLPGNMTFFTYLFKQNDIILGILPRYSICDINPKNIRIFKDSILLAYDNNKDLYKLIKTKINSFKSDDFNVFQYTSDGSSSLLLKVSLYSDSTIIKIICDPYLNKKKEYSNFIRNLEKYFNTELKVDDRIDYFYFSINIYISNTE